MQITLTFVCHLNQAAQLVKHLQKNTMAKFNLKNIQTWNSRNGYAMIATLTINNTEVCTMTDLGDGSQPKFDVIEREAFDQLNKIIADLPELFIEQYGCELKIDVCMFIDLLNYALETKTEFKLLSA